jgi:hypothetical protein
MREPKMGAGSGADCVPGRQNRGHRPSPAAAALRKAEEEIALELRLVEPIGYLDVQITPTGYRIVPTLVRVDERYWLRVNCDEVEEAFEVRLAFFMGIAKS